MNSPEGPELPTFAMTDAFLFGAAFVLTWWLHRWRLQLELMRQFVTCEGQDCRSSLRDDVLIIRIRRDSC